MACIHRFLSLESLDGGRMHHFQLEMLNLREL